MIAAAADGGELALRGLLYPASKRLKAGKLLKIRKRVQKRFKNSAFENYKSK